ncbi:MAG TPA: undecaprenyl-diphosphate phosphatase [Balneolaceae bacterium]|nr:undecaprenyl-diphosphate phosphatase [Balneolaceae bacterium]
MNLLDSFILGLIQGLTEFLPVSSSGHLVLGESLLIGNYHQKLLFEVVTNFGTLCSILVYYRSRIVDIIYSWINIPRSSQPFSEQWQTDPNLKLTWLIIISMIPAAIVGFMFKDTIQAYFLNPFMVCIMLMITGSMLFSTRFLKSFSNKVHPGSALLIGIAQAFAILPGISRSGSTISAGLHLGIKRKELANFSFLMVIPVSVGAMLLEVKDLVAAGATMHGAETLVIGFVTSFISGYYALKYLIYMLQHKGIYPFAWYCWAVGIAGLIYFW